MASCNESTRTSAVIFTIFGSLGVGIAEVIAIIAVPFTVSPDDLGLASGVLGSCRSILGSVTFAIFSSVLRNRKDEEILLRLIGLAEQHHLSNSSVAILVRAGLAGSISTLMEIPGITAANMEPYVRAIKHGNVSSYQ
jgi:hypothetical protein